MTWHVLFQILEISDVYKYDGQLLSSELFEQVITLTLNLTQNCRVQTSALTSRWFWLLIKSMQKKGQRYNVKYFGCCWINSFPGIIRFNDHIRANRFSTLAVWFKVEIRLHLDLKWMIKAGIRINLDFLGKPCRLVQPEKGLRVERLIKTTSSYSWACALLIILVTVSVLNEDFMPNHIRHLQSTCKRCL